MQKQFLVSFLAVMTALSGITYYTLRDHRLTLRGTNDTPSQSDVLKAWTTWLGTYKKVYQHDELPLKYNNFKDNYVYIQKFNADKTKNFKLGLNQFADFTNAEFATLQQGQYVRSTAPSKNIKVLPTTGLPASVDWRNQGAVTGIKNQGQCGSCWSFSTTGSLEGLNVINGGSLESFSEQQLVDCSGSYGNQGCNGGSMDAAFQYVQANGIELESTYPYQAVQGTCQYSQSSVVFQNTGYQDVTPDDYQQLQAAVAQQPVSIAIEADSQAFQLYSSGVFDDAGCGTNLDHGVLIVGYTSNAWIVKNSWGASWGDNGYIYISIQGGQGICGINMDPSYPTI